MLRLPAQTPKRPRLRSAPAVAAFLALALCLSGAPLQAAPSPGVDERAVELADRLMDALGGRQAWDATRLIRFRFADFRTHWWDKAEGLHRLEYTSREEGDAYVVLQNLDSREGRAFKNGTALAGDELAKALEGAYAAWINDTYWLVMPYKLQDPGVTLTYAGREEVGGASYEKVQLSFDGVGLTPGDRYWVYLNPETGLVDRWAYVLESFEEGREPTVWEWTDWKRYGDILLASGRAQVGSDRRLPLSGIAVFDQAPDGLFTSPEPVTAPYAMPAEGPKKDAGGEGSR